MQKNILAVILIFILASSCKQETVKSNKSLNGIWTESWTEKNDSEKSTINGKYWIMHRKKDNKWIVHSSIYTPISCKGSYCEK